MFRPRVRVAFRADVWGAARGVLLTRIARFVDALPLGDGVLVEGVLGHSRVSILPSSPLTGEGLRSLAAEPELGLVEGRPALAPTPPSGLGDERWGVLSGELVGKSMPAPEMRRDLLGRGPTPAARLLDRFPLAAGRSAWLGIQTHWASGGEAGLLLSTRFRLATRRGCGVAETVRSSAVLRSRFGPEIRVTWRPWTARRQACWEAGRWSLWEPRPTLRGDPSVAARLLEPLATRPFPSPQELSHHLVLLGASGSGKTTYLARLAESSVRRGETTIVFDLHGDLAPALLALIPPGRRHAVVALDPTVEEGGGPGVAVLAADGPDERAAAHVVAALKRLSGDGGEIYWGFRLERIFDTFVRLAQEEGGTLLDVFDLLTDPQRREASRLGTRLAAAERFLSELPAVLKRNPEYLGPAAARLARIALSPRLSALVAPGPESTIPLDSVFGAGRSLVVRLPLGELGPEASGFAATLLLTRLYLELARRPTPRPVFVVLDEVQAFSPRVIAEMLTEGRKFGVRAAVATQYPDRLAPELREAAAGAAGTHLIFRLPAPAMRTAATWAGLSMAEAGQLLPQLTDGWALVAAGASDAPRLVRCEPLPATSSPILAWEAAVHAARAEFGGPVGEPRLGIPVEEEALLLALFGEDGPMAIERLLHRVSVSLGVEPPGILERLEALQRQGLVVRAPGTVALTAAGAGRLGAGAEHGSSREGLEHRQLLLEAFRIFARRGERIELLRQGRFDTRLPDGVLRLLGPSLPLPSPATLDRLLERRRQSWAWRFFGGHDVFLEAEVSEAERPERIRRGYRKAERAHAFALFLVADARRARRVRDVLGRIPAEPRRCGVWTLSRARGHHGLVS